MSTPGELEPPYIGMARKEVREGRQPSLYDALKAYVWTPDLDETMALGKRQVVLR